MRIDDAVYEMKEREYRSSNLFFTGEPDNNTSNATASSNMGASKEKDQEYVQSLINKMPIDEKVVKFVRRLGTFVQGKCRPIKVVCNSSNMARAMLKNWRSAQLPNNLSIRSDQTPIEQEVLKNLNKNLVEQAIENVQDKKNIKYINGRARIVDASKKRKRFREDAEQGDSVLPKLTQR